MLWESYDLGHSRSGEKPKEWTRAGIGLAKDGFMLPAIDLPQIDTKFTLEIRERIERRQDKDFLQIHPDGRYDLFTRMRPGLEFKLDDRISGFFQYQLAYDWIDTNTQPYTTDSLAASQAYVRFANGQGTTTLGRQKINIGSERLIGSLEWVNTARSFDGVRYQFKNWDAFAVKVGVAVPKPEDAELYGLVHKSKHGQTLFAYKRDKIAAGDVKIWTIDQSSTFKQGAIDFDYDAAIQGGDVAGNTHRAWAVHGGIGRQIDARNRCYAEFNAASGGHSETKSETFDNLYPTNHKFYGSMDMQSWRNMQEISIGLQHKLSEKAGLNLHAHWLKLMDAKDAWYGAGGPANSGVGGPFVDPTGASGKDVGFEIDLEGTYKLDPKTNLSCGVAQFSPGRFIRSLNGGTADPQVWMYFQLGWKM